ncbi:membrane-bound lytic murein transglycosylase D precursor [Sporolactobacillus inulinus]|uniref:Membrane-bound lytic murein transglycosylase D n=1 Tax=Sporolactobacillus inulinus TaxID=2078 RepID=A0A4Y1ZAS3_9BACL|nr:membrane-bound lytic murein transglycosylase D precursor [Sporolactobacillus inulinus]
MNDLSDTMIHPGQKLNLQDPQQTYTVKSGDSLWAIADKHDTTVKQLMTANHLDSDLIYPEDHLTIK